MAVNGAGSGQGSIFRGQGRDGRERVGFGGSELWGVGGGAQAQQVAGEERRL